MRNLILILILSLSSSAYAEPCKTGCQIDRNGSGPLAEEELQEWLQAYQDSNAEAISVALETLLFHGEQTRSHLKRKETSGLDAEHRSKLEKELNRVHAVMEVRLVSDEGKIVAHLEPTEVRVGEKTHLHVFGHTDAPSFDISGTVMRVGVTHLWARL